MTKKFENLEYLKSGNPRQKRVYHVLTKNHILEKLNVYNPILVGTIPIEIDIKKSDLDIICCYKNKDEFAKHITENFGLFQKFRIRQTNKFDSPAVIAGFKTDGFEIEIFGQNIPVKQQNAYRHIIIENKLLTEKSEPFKKEIIRLKKQGIKTEPAFAAVMGLKGDPYEELLKFEIL